MISYRLADSIPQTLKRSLGSPQDYNANISLGSPQDFAGKNLSEIQKRKLIEENLDKGYGSCLLEIDEVAEAQISNWKHFDGIKYDLIAYVVMPNHIHILIKTKENHTLSKIVWGSKTYVSKFINSKPEFYEFFIDHYERKRSINFNTAPIERLRHHKPAKSCGVPSKRKTSIWHREYWDRFIRDEKHFQSAIEYIHNNPVKAGLTQTQQEWKYSSASDLL